MTPQEAIKLIKECGLNIEQPLHDMAADYIISVLEKQIPKKPLDKSMEYNGEYGECPCCHKPLYEFNDMFVCSSCGQALDWSDTK